MLSNEPHLTPSRRASAPLAWSWTWAFLISWILSRLEKGGRTLPWGEARAGGEVTSIVGPAKTTQHRLGSPLRSRTTGMPQTLQGLQGRDAWTERKRWLYPPPYHHIACHQRTYQRPIADWMISFSSHRATTKTTTTATATAHLRTSIIPLPLNTQLPPAATTFTPTSTRR